MESYTTEQGNRPIFSTAFEKVGHILAVFGYWNTCGHGNFILTDT